MWILCLVMLGALQYGWFLYCLHGVTNAARQGARVEATLDGEGHGDAALKDAFDRAFDNATVRAALWAAATAKSVTPSDGGKTVTGQISIPSASVALMPVPWLPVPNCTATVVMAKEGGG
jgi:Flp pilus assembly protein TadG